MKTHEFAIYVNIEKEIKANVSKLAKLSPPTTRGDYIRLVRAAIELLPARVPEGSPGYDPTKAAP